MTKKLNVLVCGTKYGKAYLSAFLRKNSNFKLAGIMTRGSKKSRRYAEGFGVRLFTSPEDLPCEIDIACVAVRASIMGGDGTRIAESLLSRGIHVIQEHPVHPREIEKCIRTASQNGVHYHVNSHFIHVEPIRIFIDFIQKAINRERPLFIEATTSLSYSLVDILANALGKLDPSGFSPPVKWDPSLSALNENGILPFQCLQGIMGGTPITLKFQNFFDETAAIDDGLLIMHRICVGMPSGNLTLLNTYGPLVWSAGRFAKEYGEPNIRFEGGKAALDAGGEDTLPSTVIFYENLGTGWSEIVEKSWPRAIHSALQEMKIHIKSGVAPPGQTEGHLLSVSRVWMDITRRFGAPQLFRLPMPKAPFPDPVAYSQQLSKNGGLPLNITQGVIS